MMDYEIKELEKKIQDESETLNRIRTEVSKIIVGQREMIEKLLIGILTGGHILLEGVPGLAKTLAVKTLAQTINVDFKRIQFTPDMLPADLIGTMVYNQKDGSFQVKKGPIFSTIILADEINRAPAKTQSALLEAMQERQVTIGETSYKLDELFIVIGTQNPIEQYGTYPLPEAQVDRFMMKVNLSYPSKDEEISILNLHAKETSPNPAVVADRKAIKKARGAMYRIYIDEKVQQYIVDIVHATRDPERYGIEDLKPLISYGASPRASIYLTIGAKANAFLHGRGYVIPDDIRDIGYDILRHRLILSYEAQAEEITPDDIIEKIFANVDVP
ncbi:MAG: ATPase [Spirochaetes bacterium]|nr:MAG: ATPase [Spirochaetota bacterium]